MKSFIAFKRLLPVAVVAAATAASLVQVAQAGPPPRRTSRTRSRYSTAARCSWSATQSAFRSTRATAPCGVPPCRARTSSTTRANSSSSTSPGRRGRPRTAAWSSATLKPASSSIETAIPWVRLSAASTTGPTGRLGNTTNVQRIDNHRRPRSPRRRLQRGNGRNRGRGPLHRRLLLLEVDGPDTTQFPRKQIVTSG